MKRVVPVFLLLLSICICALSQSAPKTYTHYYPEERMTEVTLISVFVGTGGEHKTTDIGFGVTYLCPGRRTACTGNKEAGLRLNVLSMNGDWVLKSQQPVKVSFKVDGKQINIPNAFEWQQGENRPDMRSEIAHSVLPNKFMLLLAQAHAISGTVGDVTFEFMPNQIQELRTFVKRMSN